MYARSDDGLSLIKFGSYDKLGMKDKGYDLAIFKTINDRSWAIKSTGAWIGGHGLYSDDREFLVDPQIPYIYLPAFIFQQYTYAVLRQSDIFRCSDNYNHDCYVSKPCD